MIKEYSRWPLFTEKRGGAESFNYHIDSYGCQVNSRVAFDLRYVAAAYPAPIPDDARATCVLVNGHSEVHTLDIAIDDFMRDWQSAKR